MKKSKILKIFGASAIMLSATATIIGISANSSNNYTAPSSVEETPDQRINLLKGKSGITTNSSSVQNLSNILDGSRSSKWISEERTSTKLNPFWVMVDLETKITVKSFNVLFEQNNIKHFKLFLSENKTDIDKSESLAYDSHEMSAGNMFHEYRFDLKKEKSNIQFAKLLILDWDVDKNSKSQVSIVNFELFDSLFRKNVKYSMSPINYALNKSVEVDDQENVYPAKNAVDGNRENKSRWSTNEKKPDLVPEGHYLIVDLETKKQIRSLDLLFERDNILDFEIYAANKKEDLAKKENIIYTMSREGNGIKKTNYKYNFSADIEAKYVKLLIKNWEPGSLKWSNTSVVEFSLFDQEIETANLSDSVYAIEHLVMNEGKTKILFPELPLSHKLEFNGADYEQIVDSEFNVHKPLTSKEVVLDFQIVNKENGHVDKYTNKRIMIPGQFEQDPANNKKPNIIPEIAEWYSNTTEKFTVSQTLNTYYIGKKDNSSKKLLDELVKDYEEITGKNLKIISELPIDFSTISNSLIIDLSDKNIGGFDKETYTMDINNNISIKATHTTGAYWATRTLLQLLRLDDQKQSIVKGQMKDYPKYKVRGFMLDVGRKPVSMQMLKDITKQMAWYKMNSFHVHLSDNLIDLENHVSHKNDAGMEESFDSYSGWRLESGVTNSEGKTVASEDFHYTKVQFAEFMEYANDLGVDIVPELDFPAHALAVTKVFKEVAVKEWMSKWPTNYRPLTDHIDIRKPAGIELIKKLLDDYIDNAGIFSKEKGVVVHIGADEFESDGDAYYNFLNIMFRHFKEKDVKVRLWASLSKITSNVKLDPELIKDVDMNLWSLRWANPIDMYNMGFNIINTIEGDGYMVPRGKGDRGSYQDFLDIEHIYNNWEANNPGGYKIPESSKQMLGGSYAIWNDKLLDVLANGVNEHDLYISFLDALPSYSVKLWGNGNDKNDLNWKEFSNLISKISTSPNINPLKEVKLEPNRRQLFNYNFEGSSHNEMLFDKAGTNKFITNLNNAFLNNDASESYLQLNGKNSSADLPIGVLGFNNKIKFRIKREKSSTPQGEEILFSAKSEYGDFAIKTKQKNSNNFGFSRENMDYIFNYELPFDKWVDIELICEQDSTRRGFLKLFADGVLKDERPVGKNGFKFTNGTEHTFKNSSFFIPLEKIGDNNNSFKGKISNISYENNWTGNNIDELTRLENVRTSYSVEPNTIPSKIANLQSNGIDPTKEEIAFQIIERNDLESYIIIRQTLTSKSNAATKFTKDILLNIELDYLLLIKNHFIITEQLYSSESVQDYNELVKTIDLTLIKNQKSFDEAVQKVKAFKNKLISNYSVLKSKINELITISDSVNYTRETWNNYVSKLDNLLKNSKNELNRSELAELLNKLVPYKNDLVENKVDASKKLNSKSIEFKAEFYTNESVTLFKEMIKKLENKLQEKDHLTVQELYDFNLLINSTENDLKTNKKEIEEMIETYLSIDKTNYTIASFDNYILKINNHKSKLSKKDNITKSEAKTLKEALEEISKTLTKKDLSNGVDSSDKSDDVTAKKSLSSGAVAGIVIGSLLTVGLIGLITFVIIKNKKKSK
ncbi:family 20 glycosylhydrolase [Mycoplasma crocodyli]|uniref:Putative beta-N-acetylhexosaminidase n=1 Tax=Mycoplasma crocodyli (strain ATCC 51981 / MP145) TaxID=512564 RepID=B8XTQ5_MYCCM|nr:family 20 glycosylhydrolase [Mycoplasma crocodyli]ACJ72051.1 putative beta-N-acetylhexosaminidase [Mycoplasma crocodyli MP145]ADE19410.1 putative beta-N-acetylhexosaminidase [Mycoplasma crocodyli MP145]